MTTSVISLLFHLSQASPGIKFNLLNLASCRLKTIKSRCTDLPTQVGQCLTSGAHAHNITERKNKTQCIRLNLNY